MTEWALQLDGTLVEYTDNEMVKVYQYGRQEIMDWCHENEIGTDLLWAGYNQDHKSTWGVKNEQHRTMFALRWT
jgi:hypothetical protein